MESFHMISLSTYVHWEGFWEGILS